MDARLAPRGCFDLDHNRRRSDRRSAKGLADAMSQGLKFKLFHFWFELLVGHDRPRTPDGRALAFSSQG